ncbi:molybdopterin-binding protein [Parafannyhessea umbonata]|uniref:Molybdopterin molybdenumtransferase n=1 Tax=Parafannyhessea umbonata TaxID=604330 RepID=A0A1G6IW95_9ACTN|nr:molybdopterin-binding protein [Parafannyhessea umbonata]SDC10315.1 Probable molybdopterin binding domain-containing protein [Parafannyhessea umbonata]
MSESGMRLVATRDAVGHVLCHDMTQILPGGTDADGNELPRYKGARFRKGHVVTAEDVPVLLSMGKAHLYVWQKRPGWLHEDEAARRMAALCLGEGCVAAGEPREGKIAINAAHDGVFLVDSERLTAVNSVDQVMVATRRGNFGVRAGDALAGTRVIPLVIDGAVVAQAEAAADVAAHGPLMRVAPYVMHTAAVITTGSEVKSGLIEDRFTPVVERKLARFGVRVTWHATPGDNMEDVVAAIGEARAAGVDMVLCTGGMSVDPDDNTPGAIRRAGARVVTYGAPVLPGAMLLVGYFDPDAADEKDARPVPVVGLPGCVMYSKATVFDLALPRLVAGVPLEKRDFVAMGEGGLCLGCDPCTFPHCPFA